MKKHLTRIGAAVALAGTLLAFADIAQPIAPFAVYVMVGSAVSIFILMVVRFIVRTWNESITVVSYLVGILFIMSTGIFVYQQYNPEAQTKGVLASEFKGVRGLQTTLGVIDKNISAIRKDVSQINKGVASIDKGVGKLNKNVKNVGSKIEKVKQETSKNPRKELANLGIMWSPENLVKAAINNDTQTVTLFLKGGMKPDAWLESKKRRVISQLLYKEYAHMPKIFDLFEKYGTDLRKKRNVLIQPARKAGDFRFNAFYSGKNSDLLYAAAIWKNRIMTRYLLKKGLNRNGALRIVKHNAKRWNRYQIELRPDYAKANPKDNPYLPVLSVLKNTAK